MRRGRPRKPTLLERFVGFRVPREMYEKLVSYCNSQGLTLSEVLRGAIEGILTGKKEITIIKPPSHPIILKAEMRAEARATSISVVSLAINQEVITMANEILEAKRRGAQSSYIKDLRYRLIDLLKKNADFISEDVAKKAKEALELTS